MDVFFQHLNLDRCDYDAHVWHNVIARPWLRLARQLDQPYPRNWRSIQGLTVCTIRLEGRSSVGLAFCSTSDQFSKQKGREKACTRALQALKGKNA
jgi:hypothetical protein